MQAADHLQPIAGIFECKVGDHQLHRGVAQRGEKTLNIRHRLRHGIAGSLQFAVQRHQHDGMVITDDGSKGLFHDEGL
ncbi:hypothetical protein D9M68_874530 [compost metagenome]